MTGARMSDRLMFVCDLVLSEPEESSIYVASVPAACLTLPL